MVEIPEYLLLSAVVGDFGHIAGKNLVLVGLAPDAFAEEVRQDLAHPGEKGRLLQIVVDVVHHFGEGGVHQLLGVALVYAETAGKRHETGLVFAYKPFCAAVSVLPQFFDNVHFPETKSLHNHKCGFKDFASKIFPRRASHSKPAYKYVIIKKRMR